MQAQNDKVGQIRSRLKMNELYSPARLASGSLLKTPGVVKKIELTSQMVDLLPWQQETIKH